MISIEMDNKAINMDIKKENIIINIGINMDKL